MFPVPYGIAECNGGILRRGNQLRLIVISKGKQDATLASSGVKIPVNVKMSASMGSSIFQSRSWHEDSGSNEPEQWYMFFSGWLTLKTNENRLITDRMDADPLSFQQLLYTSIFLSLDFSWYERNMSITILIYYLHLDPICWKLTSNYINER